MLTSKLAGFVGAAVLAAAIMPGASRASAANSDDQVTVEVSTTDLDMASEAGAHKALRRIQHAANEACGGDVADKTMGEQEQSRDCARAVVTRTIASMNLPALTAVSEGRRAPQPLASADR